MEQCATFRPREKAFLRLSFPTIENLITGSGGVHLFNRKRGDAVNDQQNRTGPTAKEHAESMAEYSRLGEERARALPNLGPIRFDQDGDLDPEIVAAYRIYGFCVFENVVDEQELVESRSDVDDLLVRAPAEPGGLLDRNGERAFGSEITRFAWPSH